ncbi:MAG TPA: CoA ester lyase [Hydrogenophaga sp.]|uniref:HpcH/HpaI aldolase/citrate lyase family protein n=1 Tax=Hydrogenophaga sp. TaxID=1904254 RepID=UPI002CDCD335|nr:CoA ester lyase [Hydrogenophaga sp.]HMN91617.1 CoA ester lyase [Hydrogenophaga sp.]HMP10010.1 CoA ester lyase [Hydrogenophaga sp.]
MPAIDPDLRRCWLFGPGADAGAHEAMLASGADVLIFDLEDFTPEHLRAQARELMPALLARTKSAGKLAAVRINDLGSDGPQDLAAAMQAGADIIAYPKAEQASQMAALDQAIGHREQATGRPMGSVEILPVCETARGVLDVRELARASARVRAALLGAEDLATDLCAERQPDGLELEQARRQFLLLCRAAGIEPVDAPYTFGDGEGVRQETTRSRRLGYRSKSAVRPEHGSVIRDVLSPAQDQIARAKAVVLAFEAARARGEDRARVADHWVEVPTYRHALRLLDRARRLANTA